MDKASDDKRHREKQHTGMLDAKIVMHPNSDECVQLQARFSDSRPQSLLRQQTTMQVSMRNDEQRSARNCVPLQRACSIMVARCTHLFGSYNA